LKSKKTRAHTNRKALPSKYQIMPDIVIAPNRAGSQRSRVPACGAAGNRTNSGRQISGPVVVNGGHPDTFPGLRCENQLALLPEIDWATTEFLRTVRLSGPAMPGKKFCRWPDFHFPRSFCPTIR
jgi:hypothetical protein